MRDKKLATTDAKAFPETNDLITFAVNKAIEAGEITGEHPWPADFWCTYLADGECGFDINLFTDDPETPGAADDQHLITIYFLSASQTYTNFGLSLQVEITRRDKQDSADQLLEAAIQAGEQQAAEWDRFWAALGVLSAEITVDQAIAMWQTLEAESAARLEALKALAYER